MWLDLSLIVIILICHLGSRSGVQIGAYRNSWCRNNLQSEPAVLDGRDEIVCSVGAGSRTVGWVQNCALHQTTRTEEAAFAHNGTFIFHGTLVPTIMA